MERVENRIGKRDKENERLRERELEKEGDEILEKDGKFFIQNNEPFSEWIDWTKQINQIILAWVLPSNLQVLLGKLGLTMFKGKFMKF